MQRGRRFAAILARRCIFFGERHQLAPARVSVPSNSRLLNGNGLSLGGARRLEGGHDLAGEGVGLGPQGVRLLVGGRERECRPGAAVLRDRLFGGFVAHRRFRSGSGDARYYPSVESARGGVHA